MLGKFFNGKFLQEITPFLVEKFKVERSKEVSGATVNRNLACLKCFFNKAIAWGKFNGKNPVKGIKFFKEQPRPRFLETEEVKKLLYNCNEHLKPMVTIALHTGMPKGKILNLKWHDVDFKRDIIYLTQTKSGERREIRMNSEVRATLIKVRKHPDSPYIFCNKDGQPYGDIRRSFLNLSLHKSLHKSLTSSPRYYIILSPAINSTHLGLIPRLRSGWFEGMVSAVEGRKLSGRNNPALYLICFHQKAGYSRSKPINGPEK